MMLRHHVMLGRRLMLANKGASLHPTQAVFGCGSSSRIDEVYRWLSTAPAVAAVSPLRQTLPSNLTFDRRSSFGPRPEPTALVAPETSNHTDDEVGEKGEDAPETSLAKKGGKEEDLDDFEEDFDDDDDDGGNEDVMARLDTAAETRHYVIPLPDRLKLNVYDVTNASSVNGTLWLDPSIWGVSDIRVDLIKQNVNYIRNRMRGKRTAKTKTIHEVSGSGRKVRNQKGTGQARAGHSRPAHWRGGAKAHGPKNTRDYGDTKMNKKAKRLAMASMLSQKLKEGNVILVDNLQLTSHKTKEWAKVLEQNWGIGGDEGTSALILDHYYESPKVEGEDKAPAHASYRGLPINLWVASGNLFQIKVANQRFANVYDILKREKLILTMGALEQIEARWKD
jgi:large subunit ribosomal protein L4